MIYQTKLSAFLRQKFILDWDGIHGAKHWARVKRLGRYLGAEHGADLEVVTLFALMHDSCREDEDRDIEHGSRAALLVREMNGVLYGINDFQEDQLAFACEGHSNGGLSNDITIQVCWDADRLDLGRLAIRPDPGRMGTETAQRLCAERWPYGHIGKESN